MRTAPRGCVRVRANAKRTGYFATIPKPIGDLVGTDRLFRVEIVEDGILLRYVEGDGPTVPPAPRWLLPR